MALGPMRRLPGLWQGSHPHEKSLAKCAASDPAQIAICDASIHQGLRLALRVMSLTFEAGAERPLTRPVTQPRRHFREAPGAGIAFIRSAIFRLRGLEHRARKWIRFCDSTMLLKKKPARKNLRAASDFPKRLPL
jgi:hypothetical protein